MYSFQNYTTYSIKSGIMQPEDWAERAKELGYKALGICDKSTMAGTIEFQKACLERDIKPLIGEEFLMTEDVSERDKKKKADIQGVIILYAKDDVGMKNLIALNNFSTNKKKGFYYQPRLDPEIIEQHTEGLVCIIPCQGGWGRDIQTNVAKLKHPGRIAQMASLFGDDLYVGLNVTNDDRDTRLMNMAVLQTLQDSVKYVHTFNAHVPRSEHQHLYPIVRQIDRTSGGHTLSCQERFMENGFLHSREELDEAVENYQLDLSTRVDKMEANAEELIEKCNARTPLGTYHMPEMGTETGSVKGDLLRDIGRGFKKKLFPAIDFPGGELTSLGQLDDWMDDFEKFHAYEHVRKEEATIVNYDDEEFHHSNYPIIFDVGDDLCTIPRDDLADRLHTLDVYVERLKYEFGIIEQLGFLEYFQLVTYICDYIDKQGLGRGFARGSAAGSLVSYLLNITMVDPLRHGLLFERFLNPDRNDLPDIDLDFSVEAREEIKSHVREKWGKEKVCNIGAYGRFKVVSAIKKIAASDSYAIVDNKGEYIQYDYSKLTEILKHTKSPATSRGRKELEQRLASSEGFQSFYNKHSNWIESVVMPLQDMVTNTQIHAAGTLITHAPLDECIPIYEHSNGEMVSQWQDRVCEEAGNPKFDFLTVEGVNVAEFAAQLILDRKGIPIPPIEEIPLDDPRTMEVFTNVDTRGIFQFRTPSQREFFELLRPTKFEELVAAVALIRPGPMSANAHLEYAAIKHGRRQPHYEHPDLEPILKDTYGLIIYQEQVMEIVKKIAGFTGPEADYLRKAAGKKKLKDMMKWNSVFIEQGIERGYDEGVLEGLWDKIVAFSEYGFNKCITGDTMLQLDIYGDGKPSDITVEQLHVMREFKGESFQDACLNLFALQYDEDQLETRYGNVVDVFCNGVKEVYEIVLSNGYSIKCTENHRLLTSTGYMELQDIEVGDYIRVESKSKCRHGDFTFMSTSKVESITYAGEEMTYDVEMADPYHNFIANGIVSHNSHAVAYTLLSFYQAYIKSRHKVEFWPAVLKYSDNSKDVGSPQELKSLVRSLGINIIYPTMYGFAPDFEPAGEDGSMEAIYWPLRAIKGIGEGVLEEMCGGGRRSFNSLEELIENTDARRVHKGIIVKLIKAGFFDCIDEPWEVAKQYFELRGKGEEVPPDLAHKNKFLWHVARNEVYGMVVKPWKEIAPFHDNVMSADTVARKGKGENVFIGGYVEDVRVYRTKFGQLYARAVVTDEGEKYTVMMWGGFYGHKKLDGKDENGHFKRPWRGQVVELTGVKDIWNGYPQVVMNSGANYYRVIWDEFDTVKEKV